MWSQSDLKRNATCCQEEAARRAMFRKEWYASRWFDSNAILFNFEHAKPQGLFRRDDIGIEKGFKIADQHPNLIAQNEPDAQPKYNQNENCQGNFDFAHSQEVPPARYQRNTS